MNRVTSWLEDRSEARKHHQHPAHQPPRHQRPNLGPTPCPPQFTSAFFTRLPAEIRLQIYGWLFGHRALHYVNWWNDATHQWETFHRACTCPLNTIVDDVCVHHGKAGLDQVRAYEGFDTWVDHALMRTCWQAYNEGLPILYSSNEFRFQCPLTLTTAFPRQTPAPAPALLRRLTFRWDLYHNRHPHLSPQTRDAYTAVWRLLGATYPHLTELRIGIYVHSWQQATFERGKRVPSRALLDKQWQHHERDDNNNNNDDDDDDFTTYQDAWLDGLEWAVDYLSDLVVFQVALHVDIYHRLRARVKPFLAEQARQRQPRQPSGPGAPAVQFRMWKSPDDRPLTGSGHTRPLSAGSSNQGIDLRPDFWVKWKGEWRRQTGGRLNLSPRGT
ncbi:hypothetical protein BO71DRAFT_480699 [Aspergillus ellipticus CBS 707.79]|uniref:DUF7730 domain-containing protein n=1 Tax=Aspergillus ellipticus CBS 707.79 TaxID=1448320 RepID=A0A319DKU0_9EURO|nr:hypothetical protein BO71DRAFT_480699 [Aspergillus ellipticus CBS 707.79]